MISCVFATKRKIYEIHTWAQETRLEINGWGMAVVNRQRCCWHYRAPAAILYQYIMYWRNKTKRRSKRSMFRLQRSESVVVLSYGILNQSGLRMGEKIECFWAASSYISILNYSIIAIFLYYALGIIFQEFWKKKDTVIKQSVRKTDRIRYISCLRMLQYNRVLDCLWRLG
jgi:hypothetical protein